MIGKKKQTTLEGQSVEGTVVGVDQFVSKSSSVNLADGTVLSLAPIIKEVLRIDGKFDNDGNTTYMVTHGTIIGVSHIRQELTRDIIKDGEPA